MPKRDFLYSMLRMAPLLLSIYGHRFASRTAYGAAFFLSIARTTFHLYPSLLRYYGHRLVRAPGLHLCI